MNKTYLASFWIPQKIGPVGIGLHSPEFEEFFQTKFNNPSRDLRAANRYKKGSWRQEGSLHRLYLSD